MNRQPISPISQESLKEHPVIFFDGLCGLCNHSVDILIKRDKNQIFRFAPLQGESAKTSLKPDNVNVVSNIVFLNRTGEYHKSAAVVRILRSLNGYWYIVGSLLWVVPKPIRDLGYLMIAKNRYRFFGKLKTCRLPQPEEQNIFLP